jgi:acyl carrier protein
MQDKEPFAVKERVLEIVGGVLNEEISVISTDQNTVSWDSLAYMAILSCIEDEFGIEVNGSNINNFNSVANIIIEIENGKK